MSETDLGKIFEPFFSTKTKAGGTGLGLSITYGLIQELGGKLTLPAGWERARRFTVTLPFTPPQKSTEK